MGDDPSLTRRKILGGMSAIGGAAALGGAGTVAFFSDEEQFANNQLTAGELDMKVDWEEHYVDMLGREADIARHVGEGEDATFTLPPLAVDGFDVGDARPIRIALGENVTIDDFQDATAIEAYPDADGDGSQDAPEEWDICEQAADLNEVMSADLRTSGTIDGHETAPGDPLVELRDVKPGDFGEVTFSFHLCDNPGYVWLTVDDLVDVEGEITEPERKDPDETSVAGPDDEGELAENVLVLVWYDDGDNWPGEEAEGIDELVFIGTLGELADAAASDPPNRLGIPLDGEPETQYDEVEFPEDGSPVPGDPADPARGCFEGETTHHLGLMWWLPLDHANQVQGDELSFDVGFYAEQCRHNDGASETADLLGFYPLDTVGDGTAEDVSGNGNHGTVVGDVSSVSGAVGQAAAFDGSGDYVEVPDDASLDVTGPYTEAAWVNLDSTGGRHDVTMKDPSQWAFGFQVRNGQLRAGFEDESDNNYIGVGGSISAGTWTHLAVVYTGSHVRGYVDGSEVFDIDQASDGSGIAVADATPATNDEPLTIGAGEEALEGAIDDLRIYGRALSAAEIQQLASQ